MRFIFHTAFFRHLYCFQMAFYLHLKPYDLEAGPSSRPLCSQRITTRYDLQLLVIFMVCSLRSNWRRFIAEIWCQTHVNGIKKEWFLESPPRRGEFSKPLQPSRTLHLRIRLSPHAIRETHLHHAGLNTWFSSLIMDRDKMEHRQPTAVICSIRNARLWSNGSLGHIPTPDYSWNPIKTFSSSAGICWLRANGCSLIQLLPSSGSKAFDRTHFRPFRFDIDPLSFAQGLNLTGTNHRNCTGIPTKQKCATLLFTLHTIQRPLTHRTIRIMIHTMIKHKVFSKHQPWMVHPLCLRVFTLSASA